MRVYWGEISSICNIYPLLQALFIMSGHQGRESRGKAFCKPGGYSEPIQLEDCATRHGKNSPLLFCHYRQGHQYPVRNQDPEECRHVWQVGGRGTPDPDPRPLSQDHKAKKPKQSSSKEGEDTEDTGSSLAESVRIESASSSHSSEDSEDSEEEGVNHQGPHRKKSHSAHRMYT